MNFPLSNLYQKVAISKWQEAEFTGYFKATQIKKMFQPTIRNLLPADFSVIGHFIILSLYVSWTGLQLSFILFAS